jgi:hypothetical protein
MKNPKFTAQAPMKTQTPSFSPPAFAPKSDWILQLEARLDFGFWNLDFPRP